MCGMCKKLGQSANCVCKLEEWVNLWPDFGKFSRPDRSKSTHSSNSPLCWIFRRYKVDQNHILDTFFTHLRPRNTFIGPLGSREKVGGFFFLIDQWEPKKLRIGVRHKTGTPSRGTPNELEAGANPQHSLGTSHWGCFAPSSVSRFTTAIQGFLIVVGT